MIKRLTAFTAALFFPALIMAYTVTWTLPTGGESYDTGNAVTIQWTSDFAPFYGSINLYQNGTFVQTIDPYFYFFSGSQIYYWTIPPSVSSASDYQIELNLGATGSWYSNNFSISNTSSGSDEDDGSIELLTNATELGVGGNEQGYPINSWYHDVKHQSLYLASDLSNAGILSGSVITGIKFKVNQTPGRDLDSLRIAYNWTSNTEISSFDTSTTVVHGPTNYFMSEFLPNNWVQFDFTTPITWDGFNNLIIEYSHDNPSYATGGGTYMRSGGTNRGRRGWTDSGAGHYPFNSNMSQAPDSKVASIRLVIEEADVLPPVDLIATPSYQQADLSWTASTSDSIANYLIYMGVSTDELDSIDAVASTDTSYSDSGLTNGTTYYYGIKTKQNNGDLSAMSTPVSATPSVETPANLSAATGSQQVTLTWDAPSGSGVDSVYIYKGITAFAQAQDTVIAGSVTSYTFTGLTNGTTYWFSIKYKGLDESFSAISASVYSTPGYTGPAWYVSVAGNNITGDGSTTAPFATIQQAINTASDNDTVKLQPGTYAGYGNYDINPQKDLIIMGVGGADSVTINVNASINNRHYGFHFYGYNYSSMKIKGVTIVNAISPDGNGGAIKIDNAGSVEIENCVIGPGNKAVSGAGIYIVNSDVTITGTAIKGNSAPMTSGYLSGNVYGVGLHISNSNSNTVTVKDCIIRGNSGTASGNQNDMYGGGFYANGISTTNFINSFIYNNDLSRSGTQGWWSRGGGGAVTNGAQVYFVHSDILKNNAENTSSAADGRGGALWVDGQSSGVYFLNSIIWGNTASTSDASEQMFASENSPYIEMNYSDAQVATSGTGNFNEDPMFADENNNNYALSVSSGLLGAGATSAMTSIAGASLIPDTDYLGNDRPGTGGGDPDIGAIENPLGDSPVPDAPSGLTATAGDGQVALSWTASSDADVSKYGIYYGTSSGPSVKQQEVSNDTSVTITDLSNNTTYYFRITAIDTAGYESSYSDEITSTPQFSGEDIYVDGSATGAEDGSSTNPYHTIQDAIAAETTTDGKRLLVLAGTYTSESGSGTGETYSFSYDDFSFGYQSGSFTVTNGSPSSLSFAHTEEFLYPGSDWTINTNNSHFNSIYDYSIEASNTSGTSFQFENFFVEIRNQYNQVQGGHNQSVNQTSFAANAVIDLQGKNITLEAVSGPDSTFIDGEGQNTALSLDAESEDYDGYASSTEFIGFTFKDGPDDAPLIKIVGPDISSSLDWAPTFTNCRFIDSEVSADDDDGGSVDMYVAPVVIKNAEPVFDGCEFRDLHVEPNSNYYNDKIYGPIRLYGIWGGDATEDDTTAFRPQFKNCVIAENSLKRGGYNESSSLSMRGGAVYVAFGVIPYFENTRIDSNTVDFESSLNNTTGSANGGGIYLDNYLSRGEYIKFVNCSISHNSALGEAIAGGGIFARFPAVELVNCVLVNNSIDGSYTIEGEEETDAQGGAICYNYDIHAYEQDGNPSHDPELRIVNSTIADNSISNIATGYNNGVVGAGISRHGGEHPVTIFNSIIYNNEIEGYLESENFRMNLGQFSGVNPFDSDNALIDYSIIEYFSETGLEEDDLIDTDPGFVGSGDYSLSDASVAIGAGIDEYENIDAPSFDYNNEARPGSGGGNPDLGAFEHEFSTTPYPAKPQNLTVDSEGDSSVTISWTANTEDDLSEYRIYYGTSAATTLLDSVSGTPSYTATELNNYTTYYFAVSAMDLDGYESGKSNEVSGEPKWIGPNWYVDAGASSSSGDGSPAAPFREIQDAIDAVDPLSRADGLADTILVLPGTYDRNDDQELYFKYTSGTYDGQPKNLVLKSRDGAATAILDGESKRVFEIVNGTDTTLQIIGFTITASDGGEDDGDGSVIKVHGQIDWQGNQEIITYTGATFKNCLIKDVNGEDAAVEVYYGNAFFIDCELSNNTAGYSGGDGLGGAVRVGNEWSEGGSTVHFYRSKLVNNTITTTSATYIHGGALGINGSNDNNVKLVNTVVAGNLVSYNNTDTGLPPSGGGIYLHGGVLLLINCTLVDNQISTYADNLFDGGSAIYAAEDWNNPDSDPPQLTIFNSIVYDNFITTSAATNPNTSFTGQININEIDGDVDIYASYSLIGGDDDLGGDDILLNIDPEFADTSYVLHERSPAIGAGEIEGEAVHVDEIYAPEDDILGEIRPNPADSNPDLGAYEHELAVTPYPSVVEDLTATPLHLAVQLEWDYHEEEDVTSYIAYMSEDSIAFTAMDTVVGRFSTRTTIDSLDNGTDYWFYVTAVDTAGYESSPTFHAKTFPFFQGPVWIVDADNGTSSGEGSPQEPMKYIRDAIEESADGDTIMLMPGTYDHSKNRNLDFQYNHNTWEDGLRDLTLMSKYGADTTIIDLDGSDFIDIQDGESDSRIEGLTISNSGSGAIRIWYSSVEIKNCIFENNSDNSFDGGGAIYIEGLLSNHQPVTVSNTLFKGNFASERGGAIYAGGLGSELLVTNCIFDNNNANNEGGAIQQDNNTNLLVVNSLFLNNQCQTSSAGGINIFAPDFGGNIDIINSIFINNTNNGGTDNADINSSSVYADHCILQSMNSLAFSSGDNYVFNPDSILMADTSDYALNEYSPAIGLGLDEFYSNALEEDVILSEELTTDYLGNARVQPADSHIDLGPIEHERWELRRKVFYVDTGGDDSNDGLTAGSPLLTLAEALNKAVIRDTIELAPGTYSGADNRDLTFAGVDRIIRSTDGAATTIIDCENMSQAFILENGETDSTIISGITIQNGTAVNGGAVFIDGADPLFEGVIFMDNYASTSGGAVYADDSDSEFESCIFTGNHAAESGAVMVESGDVILNFITAVDNDSDDDISFSGDITIINSILWGNSPIDDNMDVTYSDVMGGNDGTGNYNGRPGFVDGFDNDFRLQDWSPVIGQAEDSSGVLFDIEGNARPITNPDMGAYENALDTASTYTRQSWYVSSTGSDSVRSGMGSASDPFGSIQFAMDHAIYDDEVHVAAGDYSESLNNWSKDILLVGYTGSHPADDVNIDGYFEINGGSPALYDLHLTNMNGTSDALQINNDAVVTMYNLLITNSNYAGVTINSEAIAYMDNMTIYGNATGIYDNSTGTVSAVNSIIWNNTAATYGTPTITYSDVEGGYIGTGNINSNPVFEDSLNGDFSLQITSPCIDTGDPSSEYDTDSTVVDMGAFPLIREFLADTSTGNVNITSDESAVITQDFTLDEGDTMTVDPGATVYFDPGVTLTIDGVLAASGEAGNPVSFESTDPDSSYGGVIVNTGSGGRDHGESFSYMIIQDVGAAFIPLIINGDATIEHVTIAGNDNSTSLEVNSGTVELNYSILEGSTSGSGTINNAGSVTSNTGQFVNYEGNDFTLLPTASAIDLDTTENWIDPDYTYADAGCFYHDQSDYLADSISFLYPAAGDTILVSPDSSTNPIYGLGVSAQVFNTIGHYKTYTYTQWGNGGPVDGSFTSEYSATSDLRGIVHKVFYTSSTTGDLNSITVSEDGVTAQSGYFKVVPGAPDSVWVNEQVEMSMTQLGTLGFGASIYDQFANLVADGETVAWNVVPVVGNGDGFSLSYDSSSTSGGSVNVALSTDPTGNTLVVGDQARVGATSGNGYHESGLITIIPDDIYNLTMPSELTAAQIDLSADIAAIEIEAAMIDTFDNPLEGVEVNWEVVTGNNTGESLSAASTFTDASGIATVTLNTSTVSNSDYTVSALVTDGALLAVIMGTNGFEQNHNMQIQQAMLSNRTKGGLIARSPAQNEIRSIAVPVRIVENTATDDDHGRDHSVYDLDDTTAIIHVIPGVTANINMNYTDSTDVLLDEQFQVEAGVFDQFGNDVADGTPVTWTILPSTNVTIQDMDATTANGAASIDLQVNPNATWEDDFIVQITVESVTAQTATFNIHDITAPEAVSDLAVSPNVWTSVNDFTLTWANPSEHAGVAGAHYSIDGSGDSYMEGQNITTLTGLTLPANALSTFDVWLEDNATNQDNSNAVSIIAKWDDFAPDNFTVTAPLDGYYNSEYLRFEWNPSADATAGLRDYIITIDGSTDYTVYPDSTGYNLPDGFIAGQHDWTISAFDSSGNETITSNPQPFYVDFTNPGIAHNPVLEATENSPMTITATFSDDASGIEIAELNYRKGGEAQWQSPIDMSTLNTYQIASSFVTSAGVEYYVYARDVAGNETYKPDAGYYSSSVTIPNPGLSSTARWPTGIPNGSAVSSYQLLSFPGQASNATPTDVLVDDLQLYDDTKWRFFEYGGGGSWNEFEIISSINPGVGYFLIVKDPELHLSTGQTRSVASDQDYPINLSSGDWTMFGNPYDFNIPLDNVYIDDTTTLSGDINLYAYDGSWKQATGIEPWKGYIYKSATASKIYINPRKSSGGLKLAEPELVLDENEWLVNINARNGLGVDKLNTVGVLIAASDEYDDMDAFEPPMLPGGISLRIDNRDWTQHGDIYTTDIRTIKEDGEYWDMEVAAEDDKHNVYLNFEAIDDIPADFDVYIIDITLGVAQDLRWNPVYRYSVSSPESIHEIRFIAGTKEFVNANNAGVELYPDRFSISQNFPNPFNPQTSILITLEDMATVDLVVYNLLGEEVIRIADNALYPAGYHNFIWKGLNHDGKRVASGVYFYTTRIRYMSGQTILNQTNKMIMVK